MSDSPLTRLIRLVGGTAMLQGPIGYQVLGNLLIAGSRSPEVAGVAAALAVGSRQRTTAAQVALRTLVPAVALHLLSEREAERLRRLAADAQSAMQLRAELAEHQKARDEMLVDQTTLRRETVELAAVLQKVREERDALVQEAQTWERRIDRQPAEQTAKGRFGQRAAAGRAPTDPDAAASKASTGARAPKAAPEPGPGGPSAKPRTPGSRGRSGGA